MISSNIVPKLTYDQMQTRKLITIGLIHFHANENGEMDFLICLPEYQAILNIEVKYQLDQKKDPVEQAMHLLSESAKQVNSHDDYLTRVHGPSFSKGWKFLKIAAVLPGASLDASGACKDAPVITSETLKSKASFFGWFQTLGLMKHENLSSLPQVYHAYSSLFLRVVGSMHLIEYTQTSWHKVMGPNFNSQIQLTGDTESQPKSSTHDIIRTKNGKLIKRKTDSNANKSVTTTKVPTKDRQWDLENQALDAEKTIHLTGQQGSVLLNNSKRCLKTLLFGDFGSGNDKMLE